MSQLKRWFQYSDLRVFLWAIAKDDVSKCEIVFIPGNISFGRCRCDEPEIRIHIRFPFFLIVIPPKIKANFLNNHPDTFEEVPF